MNVKLDRHADKDHLHQTARGRLTRPIPSQTDMQCFTAGILSRAVGPVH